MNNKRNKTKKEKTLKEKKKVEKKDSLLADQGQTFEDLLE
ncbi:RNA polymerase recycling protein, partial [Acinetobacter baumannii]|nr:RNA polymerase recycling protein [Acinetobacter baumannii]